MVQALASHIDYFIDRLGINSMSIYKIACEGGNVLNNVVACSKDLLDKGFSPLHIGLVLNYAGGGNSIKLVLAKALPGISALEALAENYDILIRRGNTPQEIANAATKEGKAGIEALLKSE